MGLRGSGVERSWGNGVVGSSGREVVAGDRSWGQVVTM